MTPTKLATNGTRNGNRNGRNVRMCNVWHTRGKGCRYWYGWLYLQEGSGKDQEIQLQ